MWQNRSDWIRLTKFHDFTPWIILFTTFIVLLIISTLEGKMNLLTYKGKSFDYFYSRMETTAEILENMNGAHFEQFCGPILRKMVPELKYLVPSGTNSQGETVKSLSDGFCFVGKQRFETVHVTVNDSKLKRKWLYDGNAPSIPKGDLIKGIEEVRGMREKQKDLKFIIFLGYNRRVDDRLHKEVHASVTDEFIEIRIVDQREIVSFLDHDAERQFL